MSPLQTQPLSAGPTDTRMLRVVRIMLPAIVLAASILVWDLVVRLNDIPPYVLPGPSLVFRTLIMDWPVLSQSLLTTLQTTLAGFTAAALGGVGLAHQPALAASSRVLVNNALGHGFVDPLDR